MNEECLICKAPLEYLDKDEKMQCVVCHKQQYSKTKCKNGHFVCDECHTSGMDSIVAICLESKSANPIEILEKMMSMPFCHMHGPEHHVMLGAALLELHPHPEKFIARLNGLGIPGVEPTKRQECGLELTEGHPEGWPGLFLAAHKCPGGMGWGGAGRVSIVSAPAWPEGVLPL